MGVESKSPVSGLSIPVTVEFEDVDSFRIAHHTKLLAYLERARLRLLMSLGVDLAGVAPVVYELGVRFRKPARLLDQLEVEVRVRDVDDYQVSLGYRIRRDGATLVTARSTIAFADLDEGTLTTMPEELSIALGGARDTGGPTGRREQRLTD